MADTPNTPGAMPETTENGRDAQPAEREAESSNLKKALEAERKAREALEKRLKAIDSEKEASEKAALEKRGEFETLKKRLESEVQAAKAALNERDKRDLLQSAAVKYINPDLIDEAIEKAMKAFDYKDGELSGKLSPDEWFGELIKAKKVYDKPVAATPSLRGTMPSGGLAQPDISKMTPAQKMAYARAKK